MSDTSLNKFIGYGTNAERLAFTPSPATIAAAPHQAYIWYATDTDNVYAYTTAWHQIASSSSASGITALTSDVTATGPGSAVATIANSAVTLAKIANAAANSKLLGSGAAGVGAAYSELTLGTGLSMSGTTVNASAPSTTLDPFLLMGA